MIRRARISLNNHGLGLALGAVMACVLSVPVAAQAGDDNAPQAVSRPVVQPIPGAQSQRLNTALERLARDPRDAGALADAGEAALGVGDNDAAIGFFQRADAIRPGSSRVEAGLAAAYVRKRDPFAAIPLFERASRNGTIDAALLSDRGLAYDLVGDTELAQRYYRQALAAGHSDEVIRRLALSQAIAGDRNAMEATLSPLLQRQDRAAWRTRAFALAILGQPAEAEAIARSTLPADLAEAMTGYLRYMPRLTAAQQAAAGDMGFFPRAADIGHDDPRVAQFARPRPVLAAAEPVPGPSAKPSGRGRSSPQKPQAELPPVRDATPPPVPRPERDDRPAAGVSAPVSQPPASAGPGFATLPPSPPRPEPARPAAPPPVAKPVTLADVFAGFGKPSTEIAPRPGAVDLRKITPGSPPPPAPAPAAASAKEPAKQPDCPKGARGKTCRAKAAAAAKLDDKKADKADAAPDCPKGTRGKACRAKAAAEKAKADCLKTPRTKACKALAAKDKAASNPSRIWVQIESGRSESRLAFDWNKLVKGQPKLMRGRKAYSARYGSMLRMVTGPFPSEKAANAFADRLAKAGIDDAHIWTSSDGSEVNPLGNK